MKAIAGTMIFSALLAVFGGCATESSPAFSGNVERNAGLDRIAVVRPASESSKIQTNLVAFLEIDRTGREIGQGKVDFGSQLRLRPGRYIVAVVCNYGFYVAKPNLVISVSQGQTYELACIDVADGKQALVAIRAIYANESAGLTVR
jgi:hypothetical protein